MQFQAQYGILYISLILQTSCSGSTLGQLKIWPKHESLFFITPFEFYSHGYSQCFYIPAIIRQSQSTLGFSKLHIFSFQVFSGEHYTEIDHYPNSNSCRLHSSWLSCNRHLEEQEYRKHSITFSNEALEMLFRHLCSKKKKKLKNHYLLHTC